MGRKLNFDSTESERRMHAIRMAPDPPPFDLSTPPETTDQDELVVNEANKEVEIQEAEAIVAAPTTKEKTDASRSTTPVVHEYQKRNVKIGHLAKSPFVNLESKKNYSVSKSVETLYNMVCAHGWKTSSTTNKEIVIDTTNYYCNLRQLADSVAPGKMLINTVAEIGIHIMTLENKNPKKYIMPLRVAVSKQSSVLFVLLHFFMHFFLSTLIMQHVIPASLLQKYLIDSRYDLKDVTRCFENSPANRLDHKDIVSLLTSKLILLTEFFIHQMCLHNKLIFLNKHTDNNILHLTGLFPDTREVGTNTYKWFWTLLVGCS
jgi:hypothetical protein